MSCSKNTVTKAINIEPKSSFSGDIDSIKIYGAFIKSYIDLFGDFERIISIIKNGCLKISSPMPKIGEIYYTYKPKLKAHIEDTVKRKIFKNIKYLPLELVEEILTNGKYSIEHINESINSGGKFVKSVEIPGVTVNRIQNMGNIYYKNAVEFYYENNGEKVSSNIWILVNISEEIEEDVKTVFRYLGDIGISKRRSIGFGHFHVREFIDIDIEGNREWRMFLSKYLPSKKEIMSFPFEKSRYSIKTISGYERTGFSIGILRVIEEGSVFPKVSSNIMGRIVRFGQEAKYSVIGVPIIL